MSYFRMSWKVEITTRKVVLGIYSWRYSSTWEGLRVSSSRALWSRMASFGFLIISLSILSTLLTLMGSSEWLGTLLDRYWWIRFFAF